MSCTSTVARVALVAAAAAVAFFASSNLWTHAAAAAPPPPRCGDLTGDGRVGWIDLLAEVRA
jgi:hypothetical protein